MASLLYFATAQTAQADRVFYLVGVRHVYRIGTDMYFHSPERKQIESDYADEVSADNAHYQYQITHGGDPTTEGTGLQAALGDLANERDTRLGALYTQADDIRANHPAFNIQVDGPYQVIGVNYHNNANIQVWDDYTAYAPWPGYVSVGPNPYGWNYGAVYSPSLFIGAYHGWYGGWVGYGSPAFVGLYGMGGPMVVAGLSVNVGLGFGLGLGFGGFYANAGLGGYYHNGPGYFNRDPFRGGYISNRQDSRAAMAGRAGYAAGASAVSSARAAGYGGGIRAGSRSSFTSTGGRTGGGTARAAGANRTGGSAARSGAGGGYGHSAIGATARSTGGGNSTRGGSGANRVRNSSSGTTARSSSTNRSSGGGGGYSRSAVHSSSAGRSSTTGGASSGNRGGGGSRTGGTTRSSSAGRSSGSGGGNHGGGEKKRGG